MNWLQHLKKLSFKKVISHCFNSIIWTLSCTIGKCIYRWEKYWANSTWGCRSCNIVLHAVALLAVNSAVTLLANSSDAWWKKSCIDEWNVHQQHPRRNITCSKFLNHDSTTSLHQNTKCYQNYWPANKTWANLTCKLSNTDCKKAAVVDQVGKNWRLTTTKVEWSILSFFGNCLNFCRISWRKV